MGLYDAFGVLVVGCFWLLSAQPVRGRGDTFQVVPTPDYELEEGEEAPRDDILDINQGLIPLEAPEHSFLLEGDIIKVSPFKSFSSASPRWPKRKGIVRIPYIISYKYDKHSVQIIKEAFEDFEKFTCIQFVPYSYQRDFVSIVPLSGCFSSAGRIGGMQVLSLAPDCLRRGKGVALHELMHVLGFWHEHSRADRDKYIRISWNEILTGFEINFIKNWNTNMLDNYDYSSIMHYGRNAFSMTGLPTIIPLSGPPAFLGQRWNLSVSDIAKVNKLYRCSQVAAQPEVVPEEAIKEKVMDFIPVHPEPCSKSNFASAVVRKTTEPILSSRKTVGEDLSTVAGQLRRTEGAEQSVVVSAMTSHTGEASRELQTPSKHVLDTTQTRQAIDSVVEKVPAPWTSQNPITEWQLRYQYLKAYTPTEQSPTEMRARTAPEMEQTSSSQAQSSVLSSVEKIHGTITPFGQKETSMEVSGSKATVLEPTGELSTAVELAGLLDMGSNETDIGMGSPRSPLSVVEEHSKGQSKKVFHQATTVSMNEAGSPAYIHPVEDVLTNVTSSLSLSSTLGNPTTISSHMELGEKRQGTKVEGLTNIVTISGSKGRDVDAKSSYHEKSTMLPYIQSPSIKNTHEPEEAVLPRKETPVPITLEAQTKYMGWFTSEAPSSLQGVVTAHPVASELKENGSLYNNSSVITDSFSLPPPHLARNGYEWGTSITGEPPGSVSLNVTGRQVEVESHTMDHAELPSQIPTWGKVASLAIETIVAVHPTEQSSKTAAGPGDNGTWSQTSSDTHHHPRFITEGWSPSADVEKQTLEKTIETASMKTLERLPMTQKMDVVHRERPRRTTLTRQFPTEPSGNQVFTQLEQGDEETQSQHSSTLSIKTGAEYHEIQTSNSTSRLRAMVSPKQCGKKLAVSASETLTSHMEHTAEKFSSLNRQTELGTTGKRSPKPEIQESGPTSSWIFQLGRERDTSPRSLGGSMKPGGRNGTNNSAEHLKEETLLVKVKELTQTTPKKRTPEITVISGTRSAALLTVGSSSFFTILAHGKPTLNRPKSHFYLGDTDSVTRPEVLSTRSLELSPETELSFQLNKTVSSAERRSIMAASATAGLTVDGMSWVTAHVQEGAAGRHSTGPPSLEMQPMSLEGTAPPLVTGSLQSPELVSPKEGSVGGRRRTATSLPRDTSPMGTIVALSTDLSSAIVVDSRENQTMMHYDSKWVTGIPPQTSGEIEMDTKGSILASAEIHGTSHAGVSTRGSHEKHTELLQFQSEPQTRVKPLEEVTGPISDGKTSTHFLEETWKILTKENDAYRSEESAAAKLTRTEPEGSEQSHISTTGATSLGMESSSQLISTNSAKETEESTIFNEKKWNVYHTAGPSSQSYYVAFIPPHSNAKTPNVVPSVSDVYNPHDTENVEAADVYHMVTKFSKGALVPAGISLSQLQTLGSTETERRSSTMYGAKDLEEPTKTPTRVKNGELFSLATESSRQISETHVAVTLEEMTGGHKNKRNLEENKSFFASNPVHLHHINKRSLLGITAAPSSFILSSLAPDSQLLHSNIGHVNPRRLSIKKLFPKKHMRKIITASSGGTIQQLLLPGYLQGYRSHPAISIGNMTTPREPEKPLLRSTSKSKLWTLLQKLSPPEKKRGNNQGPNPRTIPVDNILISCSFKENLCGWKQSQNDSLDWMLQKEEEKTAESMEDDRISEKPFRSLDGYISLQPSSHLSKQKAVLISPVVYGIRCLQFWYRSPDCAAGKINFYTKLLNSTDWQKVRSMKGKQGVGWHQVTISISTTWKLQVVLEGIVGNEVRCNAQMDDLVLCQKPCGQCLP